MLYGSWFFYADKTDLTNWVLVCNEPDCKHINDCAGLVFTNGIIMKDGRLLYETVTSDIPELYVGEGSGTVLVSASVSGTDRKVECADP